MLKGVPENLKNKNVLTCSPEMLDGVSTYDFKVDWWALGVILYRLMWGSSPFISASEIREKEVIFPDKKRF